MSIGETLAEARRQAGLTVTQVSQQTRIRESIIRSIEQGDFSPCGGNFYARGHIRSIAGVVGADAAPLVREYDEEHGPPGSITAAEVFEPATPIKIRDPRPFPFVKVLAALVVAAAAFGGYRLVTASHQSKPPSTSSAAAVRPTVAPTATAPKSASASATPAVPKGEAKILLTAKQACWVGITGTNGKFVYNAIVPAGKSVSWTERTQVTIRLGNPHGISLMINGRNETPKGLNPATVYVNPLNTTNVASTTKMPVTVAAPLCAAGRVRAADAGQVPSACA